MRRATVMLILLACLAVQLNTGGGVVGQLGSGGLPDGSGAGNTGGGHAVASGPGNAGDHIHGDVGRCSTPQSR